jgi:pimeloyl-ACP methyl ester carboxylesterase
VRSAVAWAVAPTDFANPLPFARTAQAALDRLIAQCAADAPCRSAFPDPRGDVRRLLARLDAAPASLELRDGEQTVRISPDRGWMAEAIRYALYSAESARRLPLALHEAADGRYGRLISMGLRNRIANGEQIALGMLMSVTCAEDVPLITRGRAQRETANTFLGDYRVRQQMDACSVWPRATMSNGYDAPVQSAVPVLLLSGELDPATSPQGAERVRRTLTRSAHVVLPDAGHGWLAGLVGAECVGRVVEQFLTRADPAGLDTSCVNGIKRQPFVLQ